MSQNLRESTSIWMRSLEVPTGEILKNDVNVDVCVVGAGIAGLTTAYLLAREGKKVIVLDKESVGSGESGRTTAHLSNAIDDRYFEIEKLHGQEGARLVAESHSAAIDSIERICHEEEIDCGFERVDGYLFAPKGQLATILDRELQAAQRAGLSTVAWCTDLPVTTLTDGPCLKFPRQGQIHPLQYLRGLANAFIKAGGQFYCKTRVLDVQGGSTAIIKVEGGCTVTANSVVVATNTPINDRFVIHTKQAAYRTYAICFRIPMGSIAKGLYWDTLDPYHYVRIQTDGNSQFLIVGGEDHRTGEAKDESERYSRLETWTQEHFPTVNQAEFHWSGQIEETIDGLAFIGPNPSDFPNVFIATGDSGMGMTHGTIAGQLLTDLILKRKNPWAKLYDPSRITLGALKEWVKENTNSVVQYGDYFTSGEVCTLKQIQPGQGAIYRKGFEKIAIYRNETGALNAISAVCPHLGGLVRWNTAEKSWDCPCHGSRFSTDGKVIQGPAISDLPQANIKDIETKEFIAEPPAPRSG